MNGTREPLTLRHWSRESNEPTQLQDVLARVNLERGHFRDITEASLLEEIAAEGAMELSESDSEQEDGEDQLEAKSGQAATREDLFRAKQQMLFYVAQAEQDMLRSLDYVSLLESKHNHNGAITMSPILKESVPSGTLGTDIWHRKPEDKTRKAQEELLATSVRLEGLQRSADALLSAATRLGDNARKEAKFWDEILGIADKGWSVSRIKQHPHLLGVHFGSSGSSPEFARRSLAALVSDANGDITLERGIGARPMSLRAIVRKNGRVTGRSVPFSSSHRKTPLDARIRYARDSLFDEELYHELVRESRDLMVAGVSLKGSAISFDASNSLVDERLTLSLELVSFDHDLSLDSDAVDDSDMLAQAVLCAARLLLNQSHRVRLKQKASPPPPLSEQKIEQISFPILKPLIWLARHHSTEQYVNKYLSTLTDILRAAQIDVSLKSLETMMAMLHDVDNSESLVSSFLNPLRSTASLAITPPNSSPPLTIDLQIDTSLGSATGSTFQISMCKEVRGAENAPVFEDIILSDFLSTCDSLVSEMLTRLLQAILGSEWKCNLLETSVRRLSPVADVLFKGSITVGLDTQAGQLQLRSSSESYSWSSVRSDESQSFSQVAERLANG